MAKKKKHRKHKTSRAEKKDRFDFILGILRICLEAAHAFIKYSELGPDRILLERLCLPVVILQAIRSYSIFYSY